MQAGSPLGASAMLPAQRQGAWRRAARDVGLREPADQLSYHAETQRPCRVPLAPAPRHTASSKQRGLAVRQRRCRVLTKLTNCSHTACCCYNCQVQWIALSCRSACSLQDGSMLPEGNGIQAAATARLNCRRKLTGLHSIRWCQKSHCNRRRCPVDDRGSTQTVTALGPHQRGSHARAICVGLRCCSAAEHASPNS